jgi:membrane fusion protein (multidrug efflux system)
MRRLITLFTASIIISVLTIQCGGNQQAKETKTEPPKSEKTVHKNQKKEIEEVPVEVVQVQSGEISNFLLLSSNLETEIMADVYARMQGIVEKIHTEEGRIIRKGDVMLSLEDEEYQLKEARAKVEFQKQQNNYSRLEKMHDKDLLSDEELEAARFALETAEIQWKEAKLNLDYMKVRAPIAGRVGERLAKIGKRIQPSDKLFSVINNSEMIAVIYVPEKNIHQLKLNQKAIVTSDNLKENQFEGWIKRISPVVDPASGTFKVTVGVKNASHLLKPGMFINVQIIIDTHKDAILIPKTAIVYENEYMNVFIVKDSLAHKIRLSAGFQDNEKVESLERINAGDKVVVVGQAGMKDKTRVAIVRERSKK